MIKDLAKKTIYIMLLMIILLSSFQGIVSAVEINNAYIQFSHDCGNHIMFWKNNQLCNIISRYVEYTAPNGNKYPAYCLHPSREGVGPDMNYNVSINEVLNDERIWRIIINGYPYKDLGLNVDDSFVATKQAIYSIILDTQDIRGYYYAVDERGSKIIDKIEELVNIGRYGSQTRETAQVFANKVGGFKKVNDNYYAQEYSVSSNINMASYIVTNITNFPNGSYIADTNGNERTSFTAGENFKVYVPKNQIKNDFEGVIAIQSKCKTYPVFYGNSNNSSLQDYAVCFDSYGDVSGIGKLNIKANTGKIQINKTDDETNKPIKGVTFQLMKSDGTVIGKATTDTNGVATFSSLYEGNYVVQEIETNSQYILNNKKIDVAVRYDETSKVDVTNSFKKGQLKITKVDKDNHKIALGNIQFDLFSEEFNKVIGTYITDVNGEIKIDNLRIGNYRLIEKNTGKWYNLAEDTDIKIEWNELTESIVENELQKGQVRIIKVDKDDNEVKLKNVKFDIKDEKGNVLETVQTNEDGEAYTSRYAIRDYEKLIIQEKETLQEYVLNGEPKTIVLEANQIKDIVFENEVKKGQIKVIKVDKDNNEVLLKDVKFDVKDEQGNIVDTIITDEKGEAITKRLPINHEYTVVETETNKEYVLTEETKTVTLKQDEIKNIIFENEKRKGQIRIIKVDKDDNEVLLEGITFDVLDETGNIVDTIKTNDNGEAITKRLSIDQNYIVVEKETREEYVLTEEKQTVTLEQDEIKNITFENEKIKGYIEITKISEDDNKYNGLSAGTPLEGAVFDIYDSENNIVDTITTAADGKATTKLLVKGVYTVKEKDTGSKYYLLNDNEYKVEIKEHKETIPLIITNKSVEISVSVEKTGYIETQKNDTIKYDFSNVANISNIYLDSFKWKDYLPTEYVRLTEIVTGTWNQDINYSITYQTNLNNEERVLANNLNSRKNYKIDCTNIGLQDGEYITEYSFNFGRVDIGFKEDIAPSIFCKVLDTVKNKDTFINKTETIGGYEDLIDKDEDKWTTVVYEKDVHAKKLPRTGK